MRILYCIPRYDDNALGNQIHTEVIAEWQASGHTVHIATMTSTTRHITTKTIDGIDVHSLPTRQSRSVAFGNRVLHWLTGYPYLWGAVQSFGQFFRQMPPYDVIHVETAFPLGIAVTLTKPHLSKIAITLPGADIMRVPAFDYGYARYRVVRSLIRYVLKHADAIRADSRQIEQLALTYNAIPSRLTAVPYNITVHSFFADDSDVRTEKLRAREYLMGTYSIPADATIVLSLNRLHPFKGIEYIIEAIPAAVAAGLNVHLLVVGHNRTTPTFGDYGAHLADKARILAVSERVHFVGGIPHHEARTYLAGSDTTIVPSIAESFSRVVIESAAAGTPPIVTATTGASDYVRDAQCGVVVAPQSAESIANGIIAVRTSHEALAERCIPFSQNFRSRVIARTLLDIYEAL
jgi:glycosyltransferase involved in cell wall biosynthesis